MARKGVGALRRGQVVTSFGPGATIDLPDLSVIIGGLEWWRGFDRERILEPRLESKVAEVLGVPRIALFAPPAELKDPGAPLVGIQVVEFPLWFVAEHEVARGTRRSRALVHRNALDNQGRYELDGKKHEVTPVRFVQACRNGHIADIEWYEFTHGGRTQCRRPLWLDEQGTSGDLTDLIARCECGLSRPLAQAVKPTVLGQCKGQRPWLPQGEQCGGAGGTPEMMRLLIRTASNAYFPQRLSVLSLPEGSDRIRAAVEKVWIVIEGVQTVEDLALFRRMNRPVREALDSVSDSDVLPFIVARREGRPVPRRPIKIEEFDALTQAAESLGEDVPDGDFFARRLHLPDPAPPLLSAVDRIILVHRLREVAAQVGFTRFEAVVPDIQGELDLEVRRAAIATEPTWMPAVETRGEGIFVAFRQAALDAWRQRPAVRAREDAFRVAAARQRPPINPPDVTYLMLHSLSHLLITAVALDCGYNTSSVRERIYVTPQGGGILVYTGTADSEGTLGGLVQAGHRLERYLKMALDLGRLCSNDPICAQHAPDMALEERYSLGAACHGCLLISETCCERRNELLDRALVVATVEGLGCEFFEESR